jgi:hypothetical protein
MEATAMFGIAAIVAFAIALILWLASVANGVLLTWQTFALIGLLCLSVHLVRPWWPSRQA